MVSSRKKMWGGFVGVCILLVLSPFPLRAQFTTANLGGTVLDPSSEPVPQAKVTVENIATGFSQTVMTGDTGEYDFPRLPIGTYKLAIEKRGFDTYIQSGITLTVNQSARQQVTLKLGQVTEKVTVTGNAPLVTTASSTVGQLVNTQQILDLPLSGREVQSLIFLGAGTTNATSHYCGYGCIGGTFPEEQYAKVNGTFANGVAYQLDGADFNNMLLNTNLPFPNPDSVQEFNSQTDNMSAEYGNAVGGIVSVVTKSGTNHVHGSGFEFLRNGALDSRNFFAPTSDNLKQNQFGGTIGGPIKKKELFYFGSYQGTRILTAPQGQIQFVPTSDERNGDFSDLLPGTQLVDPVTGVAFLDNQISSGRLSPVAQELLGYIPSPNGPGRELTFTGAAANQNEDQFSTKIDFQHNKHQLSGHYLFNRFTKPAFSSKTNLLQDSPGSHVTSQNISLNYAYNVSPTMLMNTWYGWNHETGENLDVAPIGFPDLGVKIAGPSVPQILLGVVGGFSINAGFFGDFTRQVQTLREDVTWIRGKHEVHFGGSYSRVNAPKANQYEMGGDFTFSGNLSGDNIADFILGQADNFTQLGGIYYELTENRWSGYIQDDWHANRKLTLNFGLRWDPFLPYRDAKDRLGCYEPGKQSSRYPNAPVGLLYGGDAGCPPSGSYSNLSNFGPRLGFAYRLTDDGKTSLRGGIGLYYTIPNIVAYQDATSIPPFAPAVSLTDVSFTDPYGSAGVVNPFPAQFGPNVAGPNTVFPTPLALPYMFAQDFRAPQITSWNLTLERQLGASWLVRAAYVGNKGTHLFGDGSQEIGLQQANPAIYIPGQSSVANEQQRRINPNFSTVLVDVSSINSNYSGLQLTLEKRVSHGLSLLANYTWSKELNDFAPLGAGSNTNPFIREFDYGLSDDDLTDAFKLSLVYQLPEFRHSGWQNRLTSGWSVSSIASWQSGFPFSVFSGYDNSFSGIGADRADLIGTSIAQARLDPGRSHGQLVQEYFNIAAFDPNAIGTYGNTGKNVLRGPGFFDTDFALMKNTKLTERTTLQFRAEAFNLFNSVNFLNPDNIVTDSAFGQLTAAQSPRILQFALKILF
jgi:hypothetical protein